MSAAKSSTLLQAFHECLPVSERHCKEPIGMLRRNGTAPLGSLSVAAQIPKARQSRSHRDSLKDSSSFVLSVKRLLVQWSRNGGLSSNPCFYSNLICGIGNVTSLLIFSPAQYKVRPLTAIVPSSYGILGLTKPPISKHQTLARNSTVSEKIKQ